MKKRIKLTTCIISTILLLNLGMAINAEEPALSAGEIIKKVDQVAKVPVSKGVMAQTITTTGGAKRTLVMEAYSKDGTDKQLSKYIEPARVKGEAILMLNDGNDIWYYSPRTDRVRKIASNSKKKKVMGSDFSYEDMASGEMAKKYTSKLIGEEKEQGKSCYVLEMIPAPEGPSYSKIKVWVDKSTFVAIRVDYWDGEKKPFKRLIVSDVKEIEGRVTPMNYTMTNLKEGSETVMEVKEMTYKVDLKDSLFTVRNLKKR